MKFLLKILVLLAFGAAGSHVAAQVYETTDAEGQPVFSDTPSPDAVPVEVEPTNRADSIEVPPPAAAPEPAHKAATPEPGTVEYQQKLDREMEAYEQEQERQEREQHSEKRQEVGDDTYMKRHEVGHDASEKRHEVGHDASEERHEVGHDGSEKRR